MKTKLASAALAAVLMASIGLASAGFAADPTWSIIVHFTYANGFEFDYTLAAGLTAPEVSSYLADCGASHSAASVVRYYCYAIPE